MSGEFLFDTNILVYSFDKTEKNKRERCKKMVAKIFKGGTGAVTNQVLAELLTVLTEKIEKPIEKEKAQTIIAGFVDSNNWVKLNYKARTVKKASNTSERHKIPFWDALIVETMLENEVFNIYTEDTKHFSKPSQIKAVNPLK